MSDRGPAAKPAEAAPKPRLVEVELIRKYCPHHLVDADGNVTPNTPGGARGDGVLATVEPGLVRLAGEDATIALNAGAARPTANTFKGLS